MNLFGLTEVFPNISYLFDLQKQGYNLCFVAAIAVIIVRQGLCGWPLQTACHIPNRLLIQK